MLLVVVVEAHKLDLQVVDLVVVVVVVETAHLPQ
jgi:hypothetical protein